MFLRPCLSNHLAALSRIVAVLIIGAHCRRTVAVVEVERGGL
jgi:hypothetical protein